ncbi:enamine deaminase RidA (YjgF/YER057c/UK114 family) [Stackebrandtia albiflava]|uniref:Enamine deaminase RidA (YjgF/YER057c/UK114 family) n=1 Tax=Stackebrandtia albiflava TaxID=406432 RepID=A0A562UQI2_9ACTN|nr:RidA family protein [Stackebrandtia albiflava]TWJ07871.1 enamine deaminase RidA (YjgF/YER057c/UK114 family) [Stackebrandtia albiflava]
MQITFDDPPGVWLPAGRYSQVARVDVGTGALLFVSGQVAVDESGELVGPDDMTAQAHAVMRSLSTVLAAHGGTLADVVNIRSFLTDLGRLAEYGAVRRGYLGDDLPTSTTVEVGRLFVPGALLEVEVVAAIPH